MMERAKEIKDLKCQVSFVLVPEAQLLGEKKKKRSLKYIADFTYTIIKTGQQIIEDVKSVQTRQLDSYRIKKHLMNSLLNLDICEY